MDYPLLPSFDIPLLSNPDTYTHILTRNGDVSDVAARMVEDEGAGVHSGEGGIQIRAHLKR